MKRIYFALLASASCLSLGFPEAAANEAQFVTAPVVIYADQSATAAPAPMRTAAAERANMGGGFIEFLFGGGQGQGDRYQSQGTTYPQPSYQQRPMSLPSYQQQAMPQPGLSEPARPAFDPKYEKQMVDYDGREGAGTLVVDTPNKFLYLVQGNGKALRYGIGVGRPGAPTTKTV